MAALLPGPWLYWTVVVLLLALPFAASIWWLRRRAGDRPVDEPARWATKQDLKPLIVKKPTGRRLTLGTAHGKLLAAEPGHSLLVMGPTQSGKTSRAGDPGDPRLGRAGGRHLGEDRPARRHARRTVGEGRDVGV